MESRTVERCGNRVDAKISEPREKVRGAGDKKPEAGAKGSWRCMRRFEGLLCPLFSRLPSKTVSLLYLAL